MTVPADNSARLLALTAHDRTLLVEAGAGSGKTAIMAGRVTMLLLEGIEPRHIVAITFTEAAAGELLSRIRQFLIRLQQDDIPVELSVALKAGLSHAQRQGLAAALEHVDELTCSTIHGFCQQLIRPYPVEAGTDPGAGVMDALTTTLQLSEAVDGWLRQRLDSDEGGVLPELVWQNPAQALALVRSIVKEKQKNPGLLPPSGEGAQQHVAAFRAAAEQFASSCGGSPIRVAEVEAIAKELAETAAAMSISPEGPDDGQLIRMLGLELSTVVLTGSGSFRKLQYKGRYEEAARAVSQPKTAGAALLAALQGYNNDCEVKWQAARSAIAGLVLSRVMQEVAPIMETFRHNKRVTARLDFDDLLHTAARLLRDSPAVRTALGQRYRHVLVDEFQDTDPLQAEILWRLCGDCDDPAADWNRWSIRPGALFLVGDPKQAIYRFRGADVRTYLQARNALLESDPEAVLSISTNFRSQPGVLDFANLVFQDVLDAPGQPGFTPLDAFVKEQPGLPPVTQLPISLPPGIKSNVGELRQAESAAVADLCARLIGGQQVRDRGTGELRDCRPGDIALLAPAGTELHLYEDQLEDRGIPIATQAGKGLYRRQEIQDMISLIRLLADSADTLALGAFLRGPLVGLTDEQLLDIVAELPRDPEQPDSLPRLSIMIDPSFISHDYARDIFAKLGTLYRRANQTTPHDLLSQAVNLLHIRPLLSGRYGRRAERALANLDTWLELLRPYGVRGLRAAARAMTESWTDDERAVEGSTDAPEDSVSIVTMHSAKGLEWPVVIPVNGMGPPKAVDSSFCDRRSNSLFCAVMGLKPTGFQEAADHEAAEQALERTRLWYVALTRARDNLIIPVWPQEGNQTALVDSVALLQHAANLPEIDVAHFSATVNLDRDRQRNEQTAGIFAQQAAAISAARRSVSWKAPSRDEQTGPLLQDVDKQLEFIADEPPADRPQGGFSRGLVLHKLLEEVLTGEVADSPASLQSRAAELILQLGLEPTSTAAAGLSPAELAGCVNRALMLPQISSVRERLVPEFNIGYSRWQEGTEEVVAGISDAVAYDSSGTPQLVVDWKSDVQPNAASNEHYRAQIGAYLTAIGAPLGMIVYLTSGQVVEVQA